MAIDILKAHFSGEDTARAEIESAGFFAITVETPAGEVGDHWHDFDAMVYMLGGELTVTDSDSGEQCVLGAGDLLKAPARAVHQELHGDYKAVIGISVDPATLTQPINKMGRPD
jgi:quercetin dioxygenase-like cupin family protein